TRRSAAASRARGPGARAGARCTGRRRGTARRRAPRARRRARRAGGDREGAAVEVGERVRRKLFRLGAASEHNRAKPYDQAHLHGSPPTARTRVAHASAGADRDIHGALWSIPMPSRKAEQIVRVLRNEILSGQRTPGAKLPTYDALIEQYGVTRPTVARVLKALRNEGLITVNGTRGVFVAKRFPHHSRYFWVSSEQP